MCLSSAPAELSQTTLYAGEAFLRNRLVHVVGYANSVQNLSGGPNCMMLPFQAGVPMTPANIVDTSMAEHCLDDMGRAVYRPEPVLARGGQSFGVTRDSVVHVFRMGIYDVVLGQVGANLIGGLMQVSPNKRPKISEQIIEFWERMYPGYTLAICCFNNNDVAQSTPLLWWYDPADSKVIVAPAIDGHDGRPPQLDAMVDVDHVLVTSNPGMKRGAKVQYRNRTQFSVDLEQLLPVQVIGQKLEGRLRNGDFIIPVEMVRDGRWDMSRVSRGIHQIAA